MKIDGKALLFRTATWWPTRRRLNFLRKGNSIHLLETALVVEGYQQRFTLPIVDLFFRQALSEWTTLTIPYSRILDYRFRAMLWWRVSAMVALWLPAVIFIGFGLFDSRSSPGNAVNLMFIGVGFAAVALVLGFLMFTTWLAPRHQLLFRQADGKRALIVFSINSKKRQEAFVSQLEANREVSRGRVAEVVESDDVPSAVPFVLLLLLLLGRDLGPGLIHGLRPENVLVPSLADAALNSAAVALVALLLLAPRSAALRWSAVGALVAKGLWVWANVPSAPWLPPHAVPNQGEVTMGGLYYLALAAVVAFVPLTSSRRKKP